MTWLFIYWPCSVASHTAGLYLFYPTTETTETGALSISACAKFNILEGILQRTRPNEVQLKCGHTHATIGLWYMTINYRSGRHLHTFISFMSYTHFSLAFPFNMLYDFQSCHVDFDTQRIKLRSPSVRELTNQPPEKVSFRDTSIFLHTHFTFSQ